MLYVYDAKDQGNPYNIILITIVLSDMLCNYFFLCYIFLLYNTTVAQLHSLVDRTKTFFALCRKDKSELREHQYQQLCQVNLSCIIYILVYVEYVGVCMYTLHDGSCIPF